MEHVWSTYENSDATRVLKQHCYVNKQCGKFWETPYQGAKALCGAGGVSEDGDRLLPVSELFAEEIKDDCCKSCLKIFNNPKRLVP
jgi:hypothetical protein